MKILTSQTGVLLIAPDWWKSEHAHYSRMGSYVVNAVATLYDTCGLWFKLLCITYISRSVDVSIEKMGVKIDSYDVSPKMREIIEWKYARKKELRDQYQRQIYNPIKQELVIDTGVQRYAVMRLLQSHRQVLDARAYVITTVGIFGTIFGLYAIYSRVKDAHEEKIRTGKMRYVDREFKFQ